MSLIATTEDPDLHFKRDLDFDWNDDDDVEEKQVESVCSCNNNPRCRACILDFGQNLCDFAELVVHDNLETSYEPLKVLNCRQDVTEMDCLKNEFVLLSSKDAKDVLDLVVSDDGVVNVSTDVIPLINRLVTSLVYRPQSPMSASYVIMRLLTMHQIQLWKKPVPICFECSEICHPVHTQGLLKLNPWSLEKEFKFCSDKCFTKCISESFFRCDSCQFLVSKCNLNNCWESFKIQNPYHDEDQEVDEEDEELGLCKGFVCNACYERVMLDRGLPKDLLNDSKINGVNFENDLSKHGFSELIKSSKVSKPADAKSLNEEALTFFDTHLLIFDVVPIGCPAFEASVTLWGKPKKVKGTKSKEAKEPKSKRIKSVH